MKPYHPTLEDPSRQKRIRAYWRLVTALVLGFGGAWLAFDGIEYHNEADSWRRCEKAGVPSLTRNIWWKLERALR